MRHHYVGDHLLNGLENIEHKEHYYSSINIVSRKSFKMHVIINYSKNTLKNIYKEFSSSKGITMYTNKVCQS